MNNIQNSLFDTMKTFIEYGEKSSTATYTIEAEIAEVSNDACGEYNVFYMGNYFKAYSINGIKYDIGDIVYVLIHNNDYSKPKTILNLVSPSKKTQINFSNFELQEIIDINGVKRKVLCLKE